MSGAKQILDIMVKGDVTGKDLLEMPQYYQGGFAYQRDSKFIPITINNLRSYKAIAETEAFVFTVGTMGSAGYVFARDDIEAAPPLGIVPVMVLQLSDSGIKGYKQASRLRIREKFSRNGIATQWYIHYVLKYGGIVSDTEHLEGGKTLWRSFVDKAAERDFKISLVNTLTGEWTLVGKATPDSVIWSDDGSKKALVVVMEQV